MLKRLATVGSIIHRVGTVNAFRYPQYHRWPGLSGPCRHAQNWPLSSNSIMNALYSCASYPEKLCGLRLWSCRFQELSQLKGPFSVLASFAAWAFGVRCLFWKLGVRPARKDDFTSSILALLGCTFRVRTAFAAGHSRRPSGTSSRAEAKLR